MLRQLIIILFWSATLVGAELSVEAPAACLMDADSGAVLYEKKSHTVRSPASITKIATALYILERSGLDLDTLATADQDCLGWVAAEKKKKANYSLPAYWLEPDAVQIGLKVGERVSVRDLLYGMMLPSGNDCANVLAKAAGGTIPKFMEQVNRYLREEVGCQATNFVNPHGLYHPDHFSTAHDMALIAVKALQLPLFREIVAATNYLRHPTNKSEGGTLRQGNRLLTPGKFHYGKAIGVKTGYVEAAQHTFVGAAESEGRCLVVSLLGCEERDYIFQESKKLLESGFSMPRKRLVLFTAGPQQFSRSIAEAATPLETMLREDVVVYHYAEHVPELSYRVHWYKVALPVVAGSAVGQLELLDETGHPIRQVTLYARDEVRRGWWSLERKSGLFGAVLFAAAALLLGALVWEFARKR